MRLRTRKIKATDFRGARIRVEVLDSEGKASKARTLAYNYAADNPHVGAAIEYLHSQGIENFRLNWDRETRSGSGNIYRVEIPTNN